MKLEQAREFMRSNHRCALAARKPRGGIQQSSKLVAVDDAGRAIISSRETTYKVSTYDLRVDPWVQLCVFTDAFFGQRIFVEGSAEVLSLPKAMDPLSTTTSGSLTTTRPRTSTGNACDASSEC